MGCGQMMSACRVRKRKDESYAFAFRIPLDPEDGLGRGLPLTAGVSRHIVEPTCLWIIVLGFSLLDFVVFTVFIIDFI